MEDYILDFDGICYWCKGFVDRKIEYICIFCNNLFCLACAEEHKCQG